MGLEPISAQHHPGGGDQVSGLRRPGTRIRAAAVGGGLSSYDAMFEHDGKIYAAQVVPGVMEWFDMRDVAIALTPRPRKSGKMSAAFMASRPRRLWAKNQVSQRVETVCSQCRLPMAPACAYTQTGEGYPCNKAAGCVSRVNVRSVKTMLFAKVKIAATILASVGALGATIGVITHQVQVMAAGDPDPKEGEAHLVGHWPFNDGEGKTAKELTGKANPGEIAGAAWVKDGGRPALQFDGKDDVVDCGRTPVYEQGDAITILLWIKPLEEISTMQGLVGRARENPYGLYTRKGNGLEASVLINRREIGAHSYVTQANILNAGEWNFVGFSYRSEDNRLRLFHNGKKVKEEEVKPLGKKEQASSISYRLYGPSNQPLSIGYFDRVGHFKGLIRDVRIYGCALDEKAIENIYKEEAGK